jgi:thiol-disulfide isomerase/thioredoxin
MTSQKNNYFVAAILLGICCVTATAQGVLRVPLHIVPAGPSIGWTVTYPRMPSPFLAPGNVKLESLAPGSSGCRFRLPGGDQVSLQFGGWQVINIRRGHRVLPYEVMCQKYKKAGEEHYMLVWTAMYHAQGMLTVGDCERQVAVQDINGDGIFDQKDLLEGTAYGIDLNGDGRIWEWLFRSDVFKACGKRWELAGLSPAGDWIEFRESKVPKVAIGGSVPRFTLHVNNGETVDSQELRGRWYLLDFWASWCVPCFERIPDVNRLGKEFGHQLVIYMVNEDNPVRLKTAKQMILKYDLPYAKAWPGLGQMDPVWRMFGAFVQPHFSIPMYVLISPENRVATVTQQMDGVRATILKKRQE